MDPKEEQEQELEVLQSIYPDELHVISDKSFYIVVKLDTESDRKHGLKLQVKYTPTYPEELPDLTVAVADDEEMGFDEEEEYEEEEEEEDDGLEEGEYGLSKRVVLIPETVDFDKTDLKSLQDKLYDEANENLGMASIFTLTSLLKDQGEELFRVKVDKAQQIYDGKLLAREQEEQKKFHGTKVTKESYSEWRLKFRKEMGWDVREKQRLESLHRGRMTGKEIFEKGLVDKEYEDDDDEEVKELSEKVSEV